MRAKIFAIVAAMTLSSSLSWAGQPPPGPVPAVVNAPLMDEGGLVLLAVALVGAGFTILRGNRR